MLCSFCAHNVCLCTLLYLRQCECALAVRHAGSTTRPPAHKPRMHILGATGVNKGAPPEHLRRHSTRGTAAHMFDRSSGSLRGYGATAARVTPDHKVGSSNLSGLTHAMFFLGARCVLVHTSLPSAMRVCTSSPARGVEHKTASTQAAHAHPWGRPACTKARNQSTSGGRVRTVVLPIALIGPPAA